MSHEPTSRGLPESSDAGLRRHVTVLFSDLCASTHLGHTYDPEIVAEILHHVKSAADRVVHAHGGVVNQVYGDGVLAVFGIPLPHEDDVRRATEAALELHKVAREIPVGTSVEETFAIRLHSGIHSGLVVAGDGDPVLGRYELIGDPVNTAAGLCTNAAPDEVIVSASTLRGALPFFLAEELPPLSLKGKPQPIPAYRVLGRSEINTRYEARTHRGLTPFVGRMFELRRLEECLRSARNGSLQVLQLVGGAGLGKTRAVEMFLQQSAIGSCRELRGYCESYGSVGPLQPFSLMLRQYLGISHETPPEQSVRIVERVLGELGLGEHAAELLGVLSLRTTPSSAEVVEGNEAAAVHALCALLIQIAQRQPLILFIDDWQWVDDSSRQVIDRLMRSAAHEPILILTASRMIDPADTTMADAEVMVLEPFNKDESTRAIDALMPDRRMDLAVAARIHRQSGGNPLYLEELCLSPDEWTRLDSPSDEASPVPATLHGLIEARVERLPATQAEVVRAAAVIGNVFPSWLLKEITGYGEDSDVVRQLSGADFIYAGETKGTLRFKHGITRDVIYESVRLRARQALHLQIAAALEKNAGSTNPEEHYEALAYHYSGGDNPLHAANYAELAGNKALSTMSLDRTRQQYYVALAALDRLNQTAELKRRWIAISSRLALACSYSPSPDDIDTLRKAADYARDLDDIDALCRIQYWLGWIVYALGDQAQSIEHLEAALAHARLLQKPKLVAQFLATLGQSQAAACLYEDAFPSLDEAIEMKRELNKPQDVRARMGTAYTMAAKAFALGDLGRFPEANELIESAIDSIEGVVDAIQGSIRALQAVILIWQGRWEDCIAVTEIAEATATRVNGAYVFGMSRAENAYARYMLDGTPDALNTLRQSSDWLVERGMCLYISLNYGWLADAMARAGETRLARHYAQGAQARAQIHDHVGEGMACRALSRLAARGEPDLRSPDHYLERAMACGVERDSARERVMTQLRLGELKRGRGEHAEGIALLENAREAMLRMEMDWHAAEATRLIERA